MKAHLRTKHTLFASYLTFAIDKDEWYNSSTRTVTSQRFCTGISPGSPNLDVLRHFGVFTEPNVEPNVEPYSDNDKRDERNNSSAVVESDDRINPSGDNESETGSDSNSLPPIHHETVSDAQPCLALREQLQAAKAWAQGKRAASTADDPKLYHLYLAVKSMVQTWQNVTVKSARYTRICVMQEPSVDAGVSLWITRKLVIFQFPDWLERSANFSDSD
ncbi:hypothetical protein KJE20_14455, partial [Pyrenophora tritici-repentis]